jgi:hypothetical protein
LRNSKNLTPSFYLFSPISDAPRASSRSNRCTTDFTPDLRIQPAPNQSPKDSATAANDTKKSQDGMMYDVQRDLDKPQNRSKKCKNEKEKYGL